MSDTDDHARLLAFAAHVGNPGTEPLETATRRAWISEAGDVTDDGCACLKSLGDQDQTRTVFRGNF